MYLFLCSAINERRIQPTGKLQNLLLKKYITGFLRKMEKWEILQLYVQIIRVILEELQITDVFSMQQHLIKLCLQFMM